MLLAVAIDRTEAIYRTDAGRGGGGAGGHGAGGDDGGG